MEAARRAGDPRADGLSRDRRECDALMADGRPVHLRSIRPDDADALVEFHRGLSPDTVYFRFFSFHPELSPREVEWFTNVDDHDRVALVALVDERIVAVGRYDRWRGTTEAEVALVVADEVQGCGLGTLLIEHLAAIGATEGLERFVAKVLPSNGRRLAVFRACADRTLAAGEILIAVGSVAQIERLASAVSPRLT
jgi:GNAT superfamily N-acetyltransferase